MHSDSACSNASASEEAPDICDFHLRGKCYYDLKCKNYHSEQGVPYQWQHRCGTGDWVDFDINLQADIEKTFCKPQNTEAYTKIDERYTNHSVLFF